MTRQRQFGDRLWIELDGQHRTMTAVRFSLEEIATQDGEDDCLESSQDTILVRIHDAIELLRETSEKRCFDFSRVDARSFGS